MAVTFVAARRFQRSKRGILELAGAIKCSTGRSALAYMVYGCYCGLGGQGWPRDKADWWGRPETWERKYNLKPLIGKVIFSVHTLLYVTHLYIMWCKRCNSARIAAVQPSTPGMVHTCYFPLLPDAFGSSQSSYILMFAHSFRLWMCRLNCKCCVTGRKEGRNDPMVTTK